MKPAARVEVVADAGALANAAADRFVAEASEAIGRSGRFVVALSGGSTPARLFSVLASERREAIDWSRVRFCWSDERAVPPTDEASNYRAAKVRLLDPLAIPAANVHRIRGEDPPEVAAAGYERELRTLFGTPVGPPRDEDGARFDLVLLGMGADGHTASLFPGRPAVREESAWAVADEVPATPSGRITLTPAPISAARSVIFLVAGADKAPALARVLEGPWRPDLLPAQAIAPRSGPALWLVDEAAAAELAGR
ncbi:MAG: 6-phosphogluconolactonase [Thermoanaerobaculia bacterium]